TAGQTSQVITITVIDDTAAEPDETVVLTLGSPTNATPGATTAYTETIVDNDTVTGVLNFAPATYTTAEGQGQVTLTVTRTGSTSGQATVAYAASGGTATGGTDYTGATGTITFDNGPATQTPTLGSADDATTEADETVNVVLSNPTNATGGGNGTATVTLQDPVLAIQGVVATPGGFVATFNRAFQTSGLNVYEPTTAGTTVGPADLTLKLGGNLVFGTA